MSSGAATSPAAAPVRFARLPLAMWGFALRTWAAMVLALYVGFWLQLESASSAAVCVGILSLQTRGQVIQKAVYRFLGTAIGVVVAIAIGGLFSGVRDLFIVASAAWIGLCVVAAGMLDGNRAYGAVLSGYTVAIVAVAQIDTPQNIFSSGINRGAAIVVGIAAVALINDVFAAPDIFPTLLRKLDSAHDRVCRFVRHSLEAGGSDAGHAATLLKDLTILHPELTALPGESIDGRGRAAAASTAVTAMVREIGAGRAAAAALATLGAERQPWIVEIETALDRECGAEPPRLRPGLDRPHLDDEHGEHRLVAACASFVLLDQDRIACESLAAMRAGHDVGRRPRLPLYKSRRSAARDGLRVFLTIVIAATVFAWSGWPATSTSLLQVGALAGISATNPNPRGFAIGALIAMPIVVALAGITEFLVLDGADAFPLLAIAMAPPVIGGALLLASNLSPLSFGIGFLTVVYFPVLLSPSNPQSYNPQTYLYSSVLTLASAIMLFLCLSILLPTEDARRRRWALASAARELRHALMGRAAWWTPQEAGYRDADRIGQVSGLKDGDHASREADLCRLFGYADLAAAARRFRLAEHDRALAAAAGGALRAGRAALSALDPAGLRVAANRLVTAGGAEASPLRDKARRSAADLIWAAALIENNDADLTPIRNALA